MKSRTLRLALSSAILLLLAACSRHREYASSANPGAGNVFVSGPAADIAAIAASRDTLNAALETRDARAFERFWLENVHITGGYGAFRVGRDSSVAAYSRFFADSSFVSGLRSPERIEVAANAIGLAAEAGRWVWRNRTVQGVRESQGRYLVMWQRVPAGWRIRSELYVTTACRSGPGCDPTR